MVEGSELPRLERAMTYVRWFGFAFGVVAVNLEDAYPDASTRAAAISIVALLALGNIVIAATLRTCKTGPQQARLGAFAFAFDALVIAALVWVFAFESPYITWALLPLLPMEGALRYRLTGALASAGTIAIFFVFQTWHRAQLVDGAFDINTYVFVVGLSFLVAGVTGAMADSWYAQNRAFLQQTLALAEVDELKDRFLAVTSHEIRGPLTAIIAGVDTVWRRGARLGD
jgi:signal transduction histidine kinase